MIVLYISGRILNIQIFFRTPPLMLEGFEAEKWCRCYGRSNDYMNEALVVFLSCVSFS